MKNNSYVARDINVTNSPMKRNSKSERDAKVTTR